MLRHTALLLLNAAICPASTAVLYNGSLGTSPASRGWPAAYDATQRTLYTLTVLGNGYTLSARFFNASLSELPEAATCGMGALSLLALLCAKRSNS